MIGTWMHNVAAQWLLVDLPGAETLVALVQTAAMVPVLVLALPAGALADILDRRSDYYAAIGARNHVHAVSPDYMSNQFALA